MCSPCFFVVVIYFCENDSIRDFMIRAYHLGMCNGEYVFVFPWLNPLPDQEWKRGDEHDEVAKEAYKYMVHVSYNVWRRFSAIT